MAIHSSCLAWKIPRTQESGRLQSIGSQRVGLNLSNLACTVCQGGDSEQGLQPFRDSVLVNREMQIIATIRYQLIPVRFAIIKKTTNNKCW